jgi:hypothetical protein
MIATEERTVSVEQAVPEAPTGQPTQPRAWLTERITTETSVLLAAAWYVLFMIGTALEPEATGSTPAWVNVLSFVFLGGLVVMVGGLIARRRWGLLASLASAGLLTASSVACPISGHHGLATWWFGQMACALGLVAASGYALTRARA